MARFPLLRNLLRQRPVPDAFPGDERAPAASVPAGTASPALRKRSVPPASELRRERRALLRLREARLRDLGGIALEMYRRDRFREDLLLERCAELIGLEARVHELEVLLGNTRPLPGGSRSARCDCGAPLLWGSHFCANCGRRVAPARDGERR
jgi:hypothetical protein